MRTLLLEGPGPFLPETLLGALCDLGASPSAVEWELGKLPLAPYHLHFERGENGGVRFTVHPGAVHTHDQDDHEGHEGHEHAHGEHGHDHGDEENAEEHGHEDHHSHDHEHGEGETALTDVVELIEHSDLSSFVRARAAAALGHLGDDFEEDAALVAVVGVVGVLAALEALEVGVVRGGDGHGSSPERDRVSQALLEALDCQPAAVGPVVSGAGRKTGLGLGRRAGESMRVSLGELAG